MSATDNVVTYTVYLLDDLACTAVQTEEVVRQLGNVRTRLLAAIEPLYCDHLWHKEPFGLDVYIPPVITTATIAARPYCLFGQTRFGDNIDDEWFIIYLLRELTRKFSVAVAVNDNDGEFLLIESALVLPAWLDPDTSENRVFLYKGKLCIVPTPQRPEDRGILPDSTPTVAQALCLLHEHFDLIDSSLALQGPLENRLREFPMKTRELRHRARCHVPWSVASILSKCPQLVSAAIEAFYLRDSTGMTACATMTRFPPSGPMVTTTVTFTRYLYAQLVSQKFYPPKPFHLPPSHSPDFLAHELGMKLTCGFEILCVGRSMDTNTATSLSARQQAQWGRYLHTLTELGYFKGSIPSSNMYRQLEAEARRAFRATEIQSRDAHEDHLEFFDPALKTLQLLQEQARVGSEAVVCNSEPDSDKWLVLEEHGSAPTRGTATAQTKAATTEPNEDTSSRGAAELNTMVQMLSSFMEKTSGLEGVEFAEDLLDGDQESSASDSDDEENDDDDSSSDDEPNAPRRAPAQKSKPISFDVSAFATVMSTILDNSPLQPQSDMENTDATMEAEPPLEAYMDAMDKELSTTHVLSGFERELAAPGQAPASSSSADTPGTLGPVALDINLVKNVLESVGAQHGLAGPVSNILGSLHLALPRTLPMDDSCAGDDVL